MRRLREDENKEFIQVANLARKLSIPDQYLSKIMKKLAQQNFVESRKGPNGGIRLASKRKSKSLWDLAIALNDPIADEFCFQGKTHCDKSRPCPFHQEWSPLRAKIKSFLARIPIN